MKTKVYLPMIAMIFAIGMSFASVNTDASSATGFIETNAGWEQVNVACDDGEFTCRMYYSSDPGTIYPVYDAPEGNLLKSVNPNPIEVQDK